MKNVSQKGDSDSPVRNPGTRSRVVLLIFILSSIIIGVGSITFRVLYRAAFEQQRTRLTESAKSWFLHIEEMAKSDVGQRSSKNIARESFVATLQRINRTNKKFKGFGKTGEFTLATRKGNTFKFLLPHRHDDPFGSKKEHAPMLMGSNYAQPMQKALSGESGWMIGNDYRGETVLAAYEAIPEFKLGVVAKIDLSEIKAPFIRAGIIAALISVVFILLGVFLFRRISEPIIAEIAQEQAWLASILNASKDGILVKQNDKIIYVNKALAWMFGYDSSADILGKRASIIVPADIKPQGANNANDRTEYALKGRRKDGTCIDLEASVSTVHIHGGENIIAVIRDVTERKQAQKILQEKEKYYRTLLHKLHEDIFVIDRNYRITDMNNSAVSTTGHRREDIIGLPCFSVSHGYNSPCDEHGESCPLKQVFETGEPQSCLHIHTTANGSKVHVDLMYSPLKDEQGNVTHVVESARDVTELLRTQENLQKTVRRLNKAQQIATMGFLDWDLESNKLFCSDEVYEMCGLKRNSAEVAEDFPKKVVHPEDLDFVMKNLEKAIIGEIDYDIDHRILRPDGDVLWVRAQAELVRDEQGNPESLLGTMIDITKAKQIEGMLRASKRLLSETQRIAQIGSWELDLATNMITASDEMYRILGISPETFDGSFEPLKTLIHPEDWKIITTIKQQLTEQGMTDSLELRIKRPDNSERILLAEGEIIVDDKGKPSRVIGSAQDITERKRNEEQMRQLTTAVEQSPSSIIITDTSGNIEYVNPKFKHVTGYERDEVLGKNPRILDSGKTSPEEYQQLWKTITAGKEWRGEFHNKKKNGDLFWELVLISPIKNPAGKITHFLCIQDDITEQKRTEEEKTLLEKQLRQSQKMQTIGTLAGGIAHDFNNILQAIHGYADMCLEAVAPDTLLHSDLQQVLKGTERAKDLVNQILTFSHASDRESKPLQIHLIVKEAVKLLLASLPSSIELRQSIADCGYVLADPVEIEQIVMNLCTNSFHAMQQKAGILQISLDVIQTDKQFHQAHPKLFEKTYIRLAVSDNGCGIAPDIQERIFEPFFTTKKVGEGTGLGLSVVHGIVANSHGDITVTSEPGKGTTFEIYLPQLARDPEESPDKENLILQGQGHILFVDDDDAVVSVIGRLVERFGYEVTVRNHSIDALETFRANPDKFDLMITDQIMPEMTGLQLAKKVHRLKPQLPIILMAGFSDNSAKESAQKAGVVELLRKPMTAGKLSETIHRVLQKEQERKKKEK